MLMRAIRSICRANGTLIYKGTELEASDPVVRAHPNSFCAVAGGEPEVVHEVPIVEQTPDPEPEPEPEHLVIEVDFEDEEEEPELPDGFGALEI